MGNYAFAASVIRWLGLAAAAAAAYWSGLDVIYQSLLIFMAADIVAGCMRAFAQKSLSSEKAFKGTIKKTGELLLVGVAVYMQKILPAIASVPLPQTLAGFYVYVELISVIENLGAFGVPIPDILKQALAKLSPGKFPDNNPPPPVPPASGSV